MSPELKKSFERTWPELEGRLRALLMRKKIPSCKRDDIVQETGLRLFGMWERVDQSQPVWGLAVTIALNLMRDEARRRSDSEILGAVPDLASVDNVERAGIARAELNRVRGALDKLSSAHRSVLLAEIGGVADLSSRGPNAVKMMRMRARRELAALLDKAQGLVALAGWRARRYGQELTEMLEGFGIRSTGTQSAMAASGWVAAVAILSLPLSSLTVNDDAFAPRNMGSDTAITTSSAQIERMGTDVARIKSILSADTNDARRAALARDKARAAARRAAARKAAPAKDPYRIPVADGEVSGEGKVGVGGNQSHIGGQEVGDPSGMTDPNGVVVPSCYDISCGIEFEFEFCVKTGSTGEQCVRYDSSDPPRKN